MTLTVTHPKVNNISDWTQSDLDAQIAAGNFPPGTVLADIVLPSDWNDDHSIAGSVLVDGVTITGDGITTPLEAIAGSGAVDSVNGQTGIVILDTGDISAVADKNYVTDANLAVIGNTSGTNTGDQSTIVGITGTKTEFDTAVTDGNFLFVGDITQYTDEMAQDAVGSMVNTSLTYVDGTPSLGLTSRTINGTAFDGTANITITAAAGTLTGGTLAAGVTASSLTSVGTISSGTWSGSFGAVSGANLTSLTAANISAGTAGINITGSSASTTGNAATATALQTPRTIGGVSFDGTANIVPQTIQVIDAASDTTTFPLLAGSATGSLQPLTDAGLSYNSSTNELTSTTFIGALTGNASTATSAATLTTPRTIGGTSFNGSANIVPTTVNWVNDAADTTCFVAFGNASGTVAQQVKSNTGFTYNASTNAVAATTFTGAFVGNVTGNVSGSSGSTTGNAATATALATGRTISGTGEATFTTTAFDGTAAVSGAVTLTNSAVIGKVLTGYTSGSGTVAATDTILQAIQKLNGNDATNANLTGPITSVGNATSVASQTGTGSTFVMNTSPTLVTPVLGAATGTSLQLSGLTASSAVATDASKNLVSVTNTGTGSNVLATSPTLVTPVLGAATATSINFGGTTLSVFEEGSFTPTVAGSTVAGTASYSLQLGRYTRIGKSVWFNIVVTYTTLTGTGNLIINGLPYTSINTTSQFWSASIGAIDSLTAPVGNYVSAMVDPNTSRVSMWSTPVAGGSSNSLAVDAAASIWLSGFYQIP